jgi:hypothetical protein
VPARASRIAAARPLPMPSPEASAASNTTNFSGAAPAYAVVGATRVAPASTNRATDFGCD